MIVMLVIFVKYRYLVYICNLIYIIHISKLQPLRTSSQAGLGSSSQEQWRQAEAAAQAAAGGEPGARAQPSVSVRCHGEAPEDAAAERAGSRRSSRSAV